MQIHSDPNKNRIIRVRVNEEEYRAFYEQAHKHGYNTLSDFIRSLIKSKINAGQTNGR